MYKQDTFDIVEMVKEENNEFKNITQRELLHIADILDSYLEDGVNSKLELKKLAHKELDKLIA